MTLEDLEYDPRLDDNHTHRDPYEEIEKKGNQE